MIAVDMPKRWKLADAAHRRAMIQPNSARMVRCLTGNRVNVTYGKGLTSLKPDSQRTLFRAVQYAMSKASFVPTKAHVEMADAVTVTVSLYAEGCFAVVPVLMIWEPEVISN